MLTANDATTLILSVRQQGASDSDVEQLAAVAQGDEAGVVDAVGADAVVGVGGAVAGDGLGPGGVGRGRGCAAGE